MSRLLRLLTCSPAALVLVGCTTTDPHAALPGVHERVADQAGHITWPLTDAARAEADANVDALLAAGLTVDSAVQIALLNNRGLRATFEELGLSQADLAAVARPPNPGLSLGLRWPHEAPRGPNVDLTLAAPLLELILRPLRQSAAADQLAAVQARVAREVLTLIADVRAAAYGVLAAQDLRDRLAVIVEIHDAAADLSGRQLAAGNIPRLEFAEIEAAAQQSRVGLARAEAEVSAAREHLNHLLGLVGKQTRWTLPGRLPPLPADDILPADPEAEAWARRPDLAAARTEVTLAEKAYHLKRRTRLFPGSVDLGVNTERDSDGSRLSGPEVGLHLPVFDQGQPELARLAAAARQARDRADALAAAIGAEARAAQAALLAARHNASFHEKILLPRRREILRETLLHYNAMQAGIHALLAARNQLETAEHATVSALRDYWLARNKLEHALGARLPSSPAPAAPAEPTSDNLPHHGHP